MKLVTFTGDGGPRVGAVRGDDVVDLSASGSPHLRDMLAYLAGGDEARAAAEAALDGPARPLAETTLLSPVPRPESVRDCMVFEKHWNQASQTVAGWKMGRFAPLAKPFLKLPKVWYEQPVYYKSNRFSVVGPEAEVRIPAACRRFDYELELGIFIGQGGRDIPAEGARAHIGGYAIFNDFSARDLQMPEMRGKLGPAKGKDFDTGNAIGPYLVTPDEIPDPYALTMVARVNGEEWSRGTTADMQHTFERIVEHVSQDETLHPGEFIGSGTVGNGCGLELDRYLKPGDVVELEIDGLGVLRNRVVAPA
jgi:2-keto-4-pentenoate hydratase/2-oxohepta-3-ene-1,7-dioic acid hydratase in catechol pathway